MDVVNINNLSEEQIEKVKQLYVSTDIKENYQFHQADYELAENEGLLEWLRGESFEDENLSGAEYKKKVYESLKDRINK